MTALTSAPQAWETFCAPWLGVRRPARADVRRLVTRNVIGYTLPRDPVFRHKGLARYYTTGSKAGIRAPHAERLSLILATLNAAQRRETWLCQA